MTERRRDPRTDPHRSLRNLLATRSARHGLGLVALGTAAGVLVAGSREDRPAQRALAHAATELNAGARQWTRDAARTGGRLAAVRFEADGKPLVLTVLAASAGMGPDGALAGLVERIRAIFGEMRARATAAA